MEPWPGAGRGGVHKETKSCAFTVDKERCWRGVSISLPAALVGGIRPGRGTPGEGKIQRKGWFAPLFIENPGPLTSLPFS